MHQQHLCVLWAHDPVRIYILPYTRPERSYEEFLGFISALQLKVTAINIILIPHEFIWKLERHLQNVIVSALLKIRLHKNWTDYWLVMQLFFVVSILQTVQFQPIKEWS